MDIQEAFDAGFDAVKAYVDAVVGEMERRLVELEKRGAPERGEKGERGEAGQAGRDGAPGRDGIGAASAVIDRKGELVLTFSDGQSQNLGVVVGKSVLPEDVAPMLSDMVARAFDALPRPKDGAQGPAGVDGRDGAPGAVGEKGDRGEKGEAGIPGTNGAKGETGERGPEGPAGRDAPAVTPGQILEAIRSAPELLATAVGEYLQANPVPAGRDGRDGVDGKDGEAGPSGKDGRDGVDGKDGEAGPSGKDGRDGVDGKDGTPGERGPAGERGQPGESGRDGLSVKEFVHGSDDHLVVVMSDGSTRDLGVFVGKDGKHGKDGRDGVDGKDGEAGPAGKDGRDGADGLGFDDLLVEHDGEREVVLKFVNGERVRQASLHFPVVLDRGLWAEGRSYDKCDAVTWAGSLWISNIDDNRDKPASESKSWRLAVKRGRDAREPVKIGKREGGE